MLVNNLWLGSLPPVPYPSAFRAFVPLSLPTPALHWITPVFRFRKRNRNVGFWRAVAKRIIFYHFLFRGRKYFSHGKNYYKPVFIDLVITVCPFVLTSHYRQVSVYCPIQYLLQFQMCVYLCLGTFNIMGSCHLEMEPKRPNVTLREFSTPFLIHASSFT